MYMANIENHAAVQRTIQNHSYMPIKYYSLSM